MLAINIINVNKLIVQTFISTKICKTLVGCCLDGNGWLRVGVKKGLKLCGGGGALEWYLKGVELYGGGGALYEGVAEWWYVGVGGADIF